MTVVASGRGIRLKLDDLQPCPFNLFAGYIEEFLNAEETAGRRQ
jgi:hypothetical protein